MRVFMSVLSHQASNFSHTHSDVILFSYCHPKHFWWVTVLTGETNSNVSELPVCCRGMFFMVSGQSVLMTTAQFESAVTWKPKGPGGQPMLTWMGPATIHHADFQGNAHERPQVCQVFQYTVYFILLSFLSCHEGSHSKQERYISH